MGTKMKVMRGLAVAAILALSLMATGNEAYAQGGKKWDVTTFGTAGISWEQVGGWDALGISWE